MKSFLSNRRLWFAVCVLLLNAGGWWWAASLSLPPDEEECPCCPADPDEAPGAAQRKALALERVVQRSFTEERELTLALFFSEELDATSLEGRVRLTAAGGKEVESTLRVEYPRNVGVLRATVPAGTEGLELTVAAGVRSNVTGGAGPTVRTHVVKVKADPQFELSDLSSDTPSFGDPTVRARFTQPVEVADVAGLVACEPPVALTVSPARWGEGLQLSGPFEPGVEYTLIFREGLRSRRGLRLDGEVRRTVRIARREPSLSVAVEGRYLAPEGGLCVPVQAVNAPYVVSAVSRVLPQNLLFFAMREAGRYEGMWASTPAQMAQSLTAGAVVRTNMLAGAARDQVQRLLLRLGDYGLTPARGVYLLELEAPEVESVSRLVCVTDLGLSARAEEGATAVWVTSLRTGLPVQGARVELLAPNNACLATAVSDAQGLARLEHAASAGEPFLLLARTEGDADLTILPLTGLNEVEQRELAQRRHLGEGQSEAFVLSDRGVYRPGETVFVQALLRLSDGRPPAPFPVSLRVTKPDGRRQATLPLMPDALGVVTAEVPMPEYLPSGRYTVELCLPGDGATLGAHSVLLESFVPPQIRVKVQGLPEAARVGEKVAFSVSAEHLFGKPAAGLWAQANILLSPCAFAPKGWEGFAFGDVERSYERGFKSLPKAQLTEAGEAAFEETLEVDGLPPARLRAQVQASVTEPGGRAVTAWSGLALDPYPFYIGVRVPGEGTVRTGTPYELTLAAVSPDGTRAAEARPLEVRVERVDWVSAMRRRGSGRYVWESERIKTRVAEARAETGPTNTFFRYTPAADGDYLVTLYDPVSKASTSCRFTADASGRASGFLTPATPERVELSADQESYRPGETARVQLRSPFAGTAWVALIKGQVRESRVIALTNGCATIEWRLDETHVPSAELAVTVVRPAVAESVWSAHRASGGLLLRVLPPERRLTVAVRPPAEVWRPQSVLPVRVAVTDSDGRPAGGAAVTLLAVDEAICSLTALKVPDPYGFFMAARADGLSLFDVYRSLMPVTEESLSGVASHVGGDGGDELSGRLNPIKARRFKPLARWRANVALDAAGEAVVEMALPEFAGELRLTAVAWDRRAVGAAAASVKIRRDLVVQPDLPRFLAPGDTSFVQVTLHNESGKSCEARVALRAEGPLSCPAEAQAVTLQAGESRTLPVPLAAQARPGAGSVTVRVEGAGEVYEEAVELAVRPACALQVTAEHLVLPAGGERAFTTPPQTLEGSFSQTFFCSAHPSVNLLAALDYVSAYPYGCCEQTVSSVLPLLTLGALAERLPTGGSTLAREAPGRVDAALRRLLCMWRWGGFAMWPTLWDEDPGATVYAAFFLACASRAGHELPPEMLTDALRVVRGPLIRENEELRAYACHILALAGQPDAGWMRRLYERREELSIEERAHLARALLLSGEVVKGREVLEGTAPAQELREAAFLLLAWLELDPAAPAVAVCCRTLERYRRDEGHWGTTQGNALALLAWGAYLARVPPQPETFTPVAAWDGGTARAAATNAYTWTPGPEADRGAVRLRNEGPGPMHVTRRVARVPLAEAEPARDAGLRIRREWLDGEGRPLDPAALVCGERVIVRLTLEPQERTCEEIVVEELLPAGLEIEEAQLAASGLFPWIPTATDGWVRHREARDDRLLLFSGSFDGPVRFHYAARAVSRGAFVVPAPTAAAMYEPDVSSRGAPGRVTVR